MVSLSLRWMMCNTDHQFALHRQVAAIRPPHLSGILVQDGYTDLYRELAFKGGVLHPNFMLVLDDTYRAHGNDVGTPLVHLAKACEQHPYYDEFWELYTPKIEDIACPMYIVCSLADNGLHTPGTIRGWLAATSETKFLELHPYVAHCPNV
jgi:predicted acyl esterase